MRVHLTLAPDLAGSGGAPEPGPPVRVVLADNHAAMRHSLRLLLDAEEDFEVTAEAGDLSAVLSHVSKYLPEVLVLDLGMHNGSSIETIRCLRRKISGPEIVVLTMQESPPFAQQAMDAGAVGFVLKDRAAEELPDAIRSAALGKEYVSPLVAASVDALRRTVGGNGLTSRETVVLRMIALGYTSAEIARNLHLSTSTVQTHRAHINRTLRLTTRAELVSYALQRRLIGT